MTRALLIVLLLGLSSPASAQFKIATGSASAAADAVVDRLDAGSGPGTLVIFDTVCPDDADDADAGTTLAVLTFSDPAFGSASSGTATANAITADASANATGTAACFRAKDSNGVVAFQGSITTSGGGGELILSSTSIKTGQSVAISALTYTQPTQTADIFAPSCSASDVQTALDAATTGDVVQMPAGTCTWGTSGAYVSIAEAITLRGAGQGVTVIEMASTAGTFGNGTVRFFDAGTARRFTIKTSTSGSGTAFSAAADGFRITDVEYIDQSATNSGYFLYAGAYGVVDNNSITGNLGDMELIVARGPTDSWQTNHSIGGANNLFIENNTFAGVGYVIDCNSNSRCVVRYNTITDRMKVDGHGKASNTPARGVRHMEVYNNLWSDTSAYWTAIELRGGSGRVFNNVATSADAWLLLYEYGSAATWPNFGNVCQCPSDYPIDDQIGVGKDTKSAASEPLYLWNNTANGSNWARAIDPSFTSACTTACGGAFSITAIVQDSRDFFLSASIPGAMSGYVPYTCPHPAVGGGSCNSSTAGRSGYVH